MLRGLFEYYVYSYINRKLFIDLRNYSYKYLIKKKTIIINEIYYLSIISLKYLHYPMHCLLFLICNLITKHKHDTKHIMVKIVSPS